MMTNLDRTVSMLAVLICSLAACGGDPPPDKDRDTGQQDLHRLDTNPTPDMARDIEEEMTSDSFPDHDGMSDLGQDAEMADQGEKTCGTTGEVLYEQNFEVLEGCEVWLGSIDLANFIGSDLSALSDLREIRGDLNFFRANNLTTLSGLESLTMVEGRFDLDSNQNLENLSGLSSLIRVGGVLSIKSNPSLTTLNGPSVLEESGGFTLSFNMALQSVTGLESYERVKGDVQIRGNTSVPQDQIDEFVAGLQIDGETEVGF